MWPAGPDRPPCGLSAPRDPCWDFSSWHKKQEEGTPPVPVELAWVCEVGGQSLPPSLLRGLGLGDPWVEGGGVLGCRGAWTRPHTQLALRNGMGRPLDMLSSGSQPGVRGVAHVHAWTPEASSAKSWGGSEPMSEELWLDAL